MFNPAVREFRPELTAQEAYDIVFVNRYMFRVDPMALLDMEEVKRRGVNTSGIARHDRQVSRMLVTRSLKVERAAEIKANRFRIGLVMPEISVRIYEGLQSHLEHWVNHLNRSTFNDNNHPIEDLVILEHFCDSIFFTARQYFKPTSKNGRLFGTKIDLSKTGVSAVRQMFRKKEEEEAPQDGGLFADPSQAEDDGLPRRESLMPYFSEALLKKQGVVE